MPIPISVVIPVKNEELNLRHCLEALRKFSEVVVVDSSSTDRTLEIAEEMNAEIVNFDWNGQFPKKRNWILDHHSLKNDWVLFLDADEVVDDRFVEELQAAIQNTECVGFWMNYTNYFLGRRLRFGVPQRKLACFKRSAGRYERIDEDAWSGLDMEVHEHPILDGKVGELHTPVDHRDFRGLDRFLIRHIDYAKWEASRYLELTQDSNGDRRKLTLRQTFKYRNIEKSWFAVFYFFYTYVIRLGCLDGRAGFEYAYYKRWYFHTVRVIISERKSRSFGRS
ncbi:MAG: glycosyltransferase family 2 protein [Pseudomonadota bacterium]